ncbi:rraga protein [Rozella allomycis CSF55]|uniref:GTP-binding protein n=1 Tax=Rozella allomycis (strain CSF55) TaxID=988480 RepID=A0A075AVG4_ROZAC|nr:Ras-related GTP-binding protein A [Rozella allomycis CSF55]RKP17986.1 rraga protein [Rozella allomycis CSF55]|eukprot:EPZ34253.1 Ras-related GTP-binding protein A [Rozella allomycis CSF55]
MGKSGAGKTSMRSIIFANYIARDTRRLGATIDVEHSHVRFLGNLVLNLWDCGGQENFMENYLSSQRDHVFKNVEVLIYVFDVESRENEKDLHYFDSSLESLKFHSPDAKIFTLIHKMDILSEEEKNVTFSEKERIISQKANNHGFQITCFPSSIWDETLYHAWSLIVHSLIPNVVLTERMLKSFTDICAADEAVIFEKATFLVIASSVIKLQQDQHRFEKISNIIKQFKLSCSKVQSNFSSLELKTNEFACLIRSFTPFTYIMIIFSEKYITNSLINFNIDQAKLEFEQLELK